MGPAGLELPPGACKPTRFASPEYPLRDQTPNETPMEPAAPMVRVVVLREEETVANCPPFQV
jgi:hypothetical protein